jgi:O-antigen chain-terminating methyltransferase
MEVENLNLTTQDLLDKLVEYVKSDSAQIIREIKSPHFGEEFSSLDDINLRLNSSWKINDEFIIRSHRRWLGKLIVFGKRAIRKSIYWYMRPFKDQQTAFNMYTVQAINEMRNKIVSLSGRQELEFNNLVNGTERNDLKFEEIKLEISKLISKLESLQNKITIDYRNEVNSSIDSIRYDNDVILAKVNEQATLMDDLIEKNNDMKVELRKIMGNLQFEVEKVDRLRQTDNEVLRNELSSVDYHLTSLQQEFEIISSRVWRLRQEKESIVKPSLAEQENSEIPSKQYVSNFDYVLFESKFRGSTDLIKFRQTKYISYFDQLDNIIDIGCGRGEFLSLMLDVGKSIIGIEMNEDMYALAKSKGLPVMHGDGIEYLRSVPDGSLGGIFSSHVIEHMPFERMEEFTEIALSKLKYGGKLIFETPNPTTLLVFAKSFYMDPTHNKPVHPETLLFLLKSKGFTNVSLIEMEPATEHYLSVLNADTDSISNLDDFNSGIQRINRILFGPQDYAVIATR